MAARKSRQTRGRARVAASVLMPSTPPSMRAPTPGEQLWDQLRTLLAGRTAEERSDAAGALLGETFGTPASITSGIRDVAEAVRTGQPISEDGALRVTRPVPLSEADNMARASQLFATRPGSLAAMRQAAGDLLEMGGGFAPTTPSDVLFPLAGKLAAGAKAVAAGAKGTSLAALPFAIGSQGWKDARAAIRAKQALDASVGAVPGMPGFYSRLERAVLELPKQGVPADQLLRRLQKSREGISTDELALRNVPAFLEARQGQTITPADLQAHLDANPIPFARLRSAEARLTAPQGRYMPSGPTVTGAALPDRITYEAPIDRAGRLRTALVPAGSGAPFRSVYQGYTLGGDGRLALGNATHQEDLGLSSSLYEPSGESLIGFRRGATPDEWQGLRMDPKDVPAYATMHYGNPAKPTSRLQGTELGDTSNVLPIMHVRESQSRRMSPDPTLFDFAGEQTPALARIDEAQQVYDTARKAYEDAVLAPRDTVSPAQLDQLRLEEAAAAEDLARLQYVEQPGNYSTATRPGVPRYGSRVAPGEMTNLVENIQSDWIQHGEKHGFTDPAAVRKIKEDQKQARAQFEQDIADTVRVKVPEATAQAQEALARLSVTQMVTDYATRNNISIAEAAQQLQQPPAARAPWLPTSGNARGLNPDWTPQWMKARRIGDSLPPGIGPRNEDLSDINPFKDAVAAAVTPLAIPETPTIFNTLLNDEVAAGNFLPPPNTANTSGARAWDRWMSALRRGGTIGRPNWPWQELDRLDPDRVLGRHDLASLVIDQERALRGTGMPLLGNYESPLLAATQRVAPDQLRQLAALPVERSKPGYSMSSSVVQSLQSGPLDAAQNAWRNIQDLLSGSERAYTQASARRVPGSGLAPTGIENAWPTIGVKEAVLNAAYGPGVTHLGVTPGVVLRARGEGVPDAFQNTRLVETMRKVLQPFDAAEETAQLPLNLNLQRAAQRPEDLNEVLATGRLYPSYADRIVEELSGDYPVNPTAGPTATLRQRVWPGGAYATGNAETMFADAADELRQVGELPAHLSVELPYQRFSLTPTVKAQIRRRGLPFLSVLGAAGLGGWRSPLFEGVTPSRGETR